MSTGPRVSLDKSAPSVFAAVTTTAAQLREQAAAAGLDQLELVNVRVSQLNGCVYCLDLHSRQALAAEETPQRLAVLPGWRDTSLFGDRERAALEIAEAVTLIADHHLDDARYERARAGLSDEETSLLTWAAITINAFNRVSIMSRHPVAERDAAGHLVSPGRKRDT